MAWSPFDGKVPDGQLRYLVLARPDGHGPLVWPLEQPETPFFTGHPFVAKLLPQETFGSVVARRILYKWCAVKPDGGGWSLVASPDDLVGAGDVEGVIEAFWEEHEDDPYQWSFLVLEVQLYKQAEVQNER